MGRNERGIITTNVLESGGATAALYLATASTIYTKAFRMDDTENITVSYLITSADCISAHATIIFQESFQRPTTEGAADDTYNAPWNMSASYIALTTTGGVWTHLPLFTAAASKTVLPFGRFRITGTGYNSGSTVSIKISRQVDDLQGRPE